jgi:hypothetical protein
MPADNKERHRTGRFGWLHAAGLGANDGTLSTQVWCLASQLHMRLTEAC